MICVPEQADIRVRQVTGFGFARTLRVEQVIDQIQQLAELQQKRPA